MSRHGHPQQESQVDTVDRLSLAASLTSAAANAVAGTFIGPLALAAVLLTGGADRSLAIGLPLALSVVTGVLGLLARRAAGDPSMAVLKKRLPLLYVLFAGHGVITGATTLVPLDPPGLDNPMYAVLLAMVTTIVAANMPTGFARISMFVVTCGPMIGLAALSAALQADGIGIALACGIIVIGLLIGLNARQAGAAFRSASELQLRNEALLRELETSNEKLDRLAHTDALTGVPNRAGFGRVMRDRDASVEHLAVLFVDLNDFKSINDRFGHAGGDHVLTVVASRITHALRAGDTVARFGGDEFVVVSGIVDDGAQHLLQERIRRAIEEPITVEGQQVQVSASIGSAITADTESVEAIIARADRAMYDAKRRGS